MQYNLIQSDILIKYPDTKPQEIIEIENITININHNKAILEKLELFKLLDFFKQLSVNITPKLLIADSPISNFKRRK
jgi:ribosomal protein L5